jgi:hypothetical protein
MNLLPGYSAGQPECDPPQICLAEAEAEKVGVFISISEGPSLEFAGRRPNFAG